MDSPYAVPLTELDAVRVPVEEQIAEQDVHVDREYLDPEEQERARLLRVAG